MLQAYRVLSLSLSLSLARALSLLYPLGRNDYENDPLSLGNPGNAIMARDDLEGYAGGGIDAKCSSILTVRGASASASAPAAPLMSLARAGPTHDPLPAFCWEDQPGGGIATPHEGHPDCFNYSWTPIQPLPSKHQEEQQQQQQQ